jgi:uncharacterized protein
MCVPRANSTRPVESGRLARESEIKDLVMGKYLLLIAGVLLVYWLVRSGTGYASRKAKGKTEIADDMVRCAHCGVHLPRSESLMSLDKFYCCDEHRRSDGTQD